ncbi:cadherin repeat domain-containing protein, partial [Gilvimarinus sp. 1_MG-2023]
DQTVTLAVNNLDEAAPSITSGATATSIDENSGAGQVVYTATADDSADISDGVTFSLSGDDAALFSIDSSTGEVTLLADPDYETQSSYSFT